MNLSSTLNIPNKVQGRLQNSEQLLKAKQLQIQRPPGFYQNPFGSMDPFMNQNRLKGFPDGKVPDGYVMPVFSGSFSPTPATDRSRKQYGNADSLFREFDAYSLDGAFSDKERKALTNRVQELVLGGQVTREQGGRLYNFLSSLFRDYDLAQSGATSRDIGRRF